MCGCWSNHHKGPACACACHTRIQGRWVEPEDATDAYVEPVAEPVTEPVTEPSVDNSEPVAEPEPLKNDQPVLVWAKVVAGAPDADGNVVVELTYEPDAVIDIDVAANAIVRTDDVPPWVKPAQCTSLVECDEGAGVFYLRCTRLPHDDDTHFLNEPGNGDNLTWTDAEAYGCVEVSS